METLTWIGKYFGFLILFFIVPPYLMPRYIDVKRDIVIRESPDKIYPAVSDLRRQVNWTTWGNNMPFVEYEYQGDTNQIGSKVRFKSGEKVTAEQILTEAVENEKVSYAVNLGKTQAKASITLTPVSESETKVKWHFVEDLGYNPVTRWSAWIREAVLSRFYDDGLKNLEKEVALEN